MNTVIDSLHKIITRLSVNIILMVNLHHFFAWPVSGKRLFSLTVIPLLSHNLAAFDDRQKTESLPFVYEGGYLNIRLQAADNEVYELLSGPDGLTLTKEGVMRYRPDFKAAGEYPVTVMVSGKTQQVEKKWMLYVKDVNRAPEILNEPSPQIQEGGIYEYRPTIKDLDEDSIKLSITNAPKSMYIENGRLLWPVNYEQAGNYAFTLWVSDGKAMVEKNIDIDVINRNRPPYWVTETLPRADEAAPYQARILAKDDDKDALTYELISAPEGLRLEGNTLTWQPDYQAAGQYSLDVSVSDGTDAVDKTLSLTVNNTNRAPELPLPSLSQGFEGKPFQLQTQASDKDQDPLTYSLLTSPEGMDISADGVITWLPDYTNAGLHRVTVVVSDHETSKAADHLITVQNVNREPRFDTTTLTDAKENTGYKQPIAVFDADGDALKVTLLEGPEGLSLSADNLLTWWPDFDAAGSYPVKLKVADADLSVSKVYTLEVMNTNRKPVITSIPVTAAAENTPYRYRLAFHDDDGDALAVEMVRVPRGMQLNGQQLFWQPSFNDAGTADVTLRVFEKSNKQAAVLQHFVIDIANTNRKPLWQSEPLMPAREGETFTASVKAVDPDNDAISYSLNNAPAGLTIDDNGLIEWQPDYTQAGKYRLALIADDGEDQVLLTLPLQVANTNRKPVITSKAPLIVAEGDMYSYAPIIRDADNEPVDLTLLKSPEGMQLVGEVLSWQPGFEQAGRHKVELTASDGIDSVKQTFILTVKNTNRLPIWHMPDDTALTLQENGAWQLPLLAEDADYQAVTYRLLSDIPGLSLTKNRLTWRPDFDQAGLYFIELQADDGEDAVDITLDVQVVNVNRPPKITSQPKVWVDENSLYTYKLQAVDPDENTVLTYQALFMPEGMQLLGDMLTWRPDFDSAGKHKVSLAVTDGDKAASQSFVLTVNNTNRAPEFVSSPITSVTEMSNYHYTIKVADADNQSTRLSLLEAPKGMALKNNQLTWSPDYYSAGTYPVRLRVSDGSLVTAQDFTLTVKNLNRQPVITSTPIAFGYEGVDYQYQLSASDADAEPLQFTLTQAPKGMVLNQQTIQWRPDFHQSGQHRIQLAVTDGIDTVIQHYTVTIENTNREPSFVAIGDQHIAALDTLKLPLEAVDVDGSNVTFTLIHAPEEMTISNNNLLEWQPVEADKGKHTIIISVSDGDLKVRRYFDLFVR